MAEYRNCPNCAAPYDTKLNTCPYCGTSYFDMAAVKLDGKPFILKFGLDGFYLGRPDGQVLTATAYISDAIVHQEFSPTCVGRDIEGCFIHIKPMVERRLQLEFVILDYIE